MNQLLICGKPWLVVLNAHYWSSCVSGHQYHYHYSPNANGSSAWQAQQTTSMIRQTKSWFDQVWAKLIAHPAQQVQLHFFDSVCSKRAIASWGSQMNLGLLHHRSDVSIAPTTRLLDWCRRGTSGFPTQRCSYPYHPLVSSNLWSSWLHPLWPRAAVGDTRRVPMKDATPRQFRWLFLHLGGFGAVRWSESGHLRFS